MNISARIEGVNELSLKLEKMVDEAKINAAVARGCALVERSAKQRAPKDTGALRRSITSKVENGVGIVFTPLEYAPYVEFGTGLFAEDGGRRDVPWNYQDDEGNWHSTSGQHPQPFLRPALNENREKIIRLMKEILTND